MRLFQLPPKIHLIILFASTLKATPIRTPKPGLEKSCKVEVSWFYTNLKDANGDYKYKWFDFIEMKVYNPRGFQIATNIPAEDRDGNLIPALPVRVGRSLAGPTDIALNLPNNLGKLRANAVHPSWRNQEALIGSPDDRDYIQFDFRRPASAVVSWHTDHNPDEIGFWNMTYRQSYCENERRLNGMKFEEDKASHVPKAKSSKYTIEYGLDPGAGKPHGNGKKFDCYFPCLP